ncbi:MAG: S-adenosyl-l-methionine hydroxide adenosyltransferase family protein [Erysipelotrichaceae bacterium]|nr:S-adenosyl-l-methionine hydroxide adenosyltransferase family protein [Erysipelotrichaceae bacterium]
MNKLLVLQSDFGLVDGAVAAMTGVSLSVDPTLRVHDLTHAIPPFDTYEASFRLLQAVPYWPSGTVFVSVVDPGVGSKRKSVVAKTRSGHYIVTPDNGTLTHIGDVIGIEEVREISEEVGRRNMSADSNTFHGRDVYAYTGALLASEKISYEEIGKKVRSARYKRLENLPAALEGKKIIGTIETLDVRFGSLWTNISRELFEKLGVENMELIDVSIFNGKTRVYRSDMPFTHTFAEVEIGECLCYVNSMDHIGVAINQGNFSMAYHIGTRHPWRIEFSRKKDH